MKSVRIDPEFKALIPPLSEEEYSQLEENIIKDGCRDAVVTWNGVIIDGHNRYNICTENDIDFNTVEMYFADRADVIIWIINNQLGRRNIIPYIRGRLALRLKDEIAKKAKENIIQANSKGGQRWNKEEPEEKETCQNSDKSLPKETPKEKPKPIDTKMEISKAAGISHDTISRIEKIEKLADDTTKKKLETGEISINQAYNDIKKEEKKVERQKQIEEIKRKIEEEPQEIDGTFDVIVIDPPWSYGREYDPDSSRVANPYPEMTQEQLLNLDIPDKDDAVLFLWTTHAFIWDAKKLMDKWGYIYKATLVWNKQRLGMGAWFRMQCEFCLVGIKGKPIFNNTKHPDIINEPRREHSRKPDKFYEIVEDITAGRRIDYFSREDRRGWYSYGAEKGKLG